MSAGWLSKLNPNQNRLRDRFFEYSYSHEGENLEEYVLLDINEGIEPVAKIFSRSEIGAIIDSFDFLSDENYYPDYSSFWEFIEELNSTMFDVEDDIDIIVEEMIRYMFNDGKLVRLILVGDLPSVSPPPLIKPSRY
jgi:hypothetical protein